MTGKNEKKNEPENELTTMKIPLEMKRFCKKNDISYRRCFIAGFNFLESGGVAEKKQKTEEINEILNGNRRLQRKLTELALKIQDLEQKKGKNEE